MNLELVTLTESSVVLTWFTGDPTRRDDLGRPAPVLADSEVLLGTSPAQLHQVHHDTTGTAYHHVEITGLEPDRTYFYVARSRGRPATPPPFFAGNPVGTAPPSASGPFVFRTLRRPPGQLLFSLALCNDLHVGETVAGLATTVGGVQIPPGVTQVPGHPPYTQVMGEALSKDARARASNVLIAAGDLTSDARPAEVTQAKAYLDAFGQHRRDYFVVRGNHDRAHNNSDTASCSAVPGHPDYHDCFRDSFFNAGRQTWWNREVFGMRLLGLDTYDSLGDGGDNGVLSPAQMSFVRAELGKDRDRPTLVVGHHPMSAESDFTTVPPITFDMNQRQAAQLERLFATAPGVFFHHSGHTHRNKRTKALRSPGVVFQEVSAVKEYPGGFTLLRVFTDGYIVNFYKFRSILAREWSERTRQAYFGGYPFYVAGTIADRNYAVARDFSGLRKQSDTSEGATLPHDAPRDGRAGSLAATGVTMPMAAAGTAAVAAAVATEEWLRRNHV
jgi:hypothetical protein